MKGEGRLAQNLEATASDDLGPDFWAKAQVVEPKQPKSVHLKLDPDVFDYFKGTGKGHITRMQEVLRAYVNAQRRS